MVGGASGGTSLQFTLLPYLSLEACGWRAFQIVNVSYHNPTRNVWVMEEIQSLEWDLCQLPRAAVTNYQKQGDLKTTEICFSHSSAVQKAGPPFKD